MHKDYANLVLHKDDHYVLERARQLIRPIKLHGKASLVSTFCNVLRLAMPELEDKDVSQEELLELYGNFEISVQPIRRVAKVE